MRRFKAMRDFEAKELECASMRMISAGDELELHSGGSEGSTGGLRSLVASPREG
jgi:hypothetical protein